MDGLIVFAIIFVVFMIIIIGLVVYKEIKRWKSDSANKKLFITNSAKVKKGQTLDDVAALLGRPHHFNEIDNYYVFKWEQTEETGFNSITRSITVVVNTDEIVVDVRRENLD